MHGSSRTSPAELASRVAGHSVHNDMPLPPTSVMLHAVPSELATTPAMATPYTGRLTASDKACIAHLYPPARMCSWAAHLCAHRHVTLLTPVSLM